MSKEKTLEGFIQFLREHEGEIDMACEIYVPALNNKCCVGAMAARYFGSKFAVKKERVSLANVFGIRDVPKDIREQVEERKLPFLLSGYGLLALSQAMNLPGERWDLSDLFELHDLRFDSIPWVDDYADAVQHVLNDHESIAALQRGENIL